MATIHPGITGRSIEPLGVSPRQACVLLNVGNTRLYQLIGDAELETYKEGRATRITVRSIRARHERQLAVAHGTDLTTEAAQPRRRGRPLKASGKEVRL